MQCDEQLRIISVSVRGYGAIMAFSIQLRGGAVIARGTDKIRDYGYDEHGNRGYQRQFVDPAQVNYTGRHGHLT